MIAPHRTERHVNDEEQQCGEYGGEHHAARGCDSDEHSVPHESRHSCRRNGYRPREIGCRGSNDSGVVGEQREERAAAGHIHHGINSCKNDAPHEQTPHRGTEHLHVARSVISAAKCLSGIGETVHHVREKGEELHEQGVDSKHHSAVGGSCREEKQIDGDNEQRADKDVAVDAEKASHRLKSKQSG